MPRRVMHIKKRTEGTSNELSFSVLDAKSNAIDVASASPRTVTELGKISVFTVPGRQPGDAANNASGFGMSRRRKAEAAAAVSGAASLALQTEVVQRKRHRRFVRAAQVLGIAALVGVLGAAGVQAAGGLLQRQPTNHVALDAAVELIAQTDDAILSLDSAVLDLAQSSNQVLEQRLEDVAATASVLDRAANAAEEATKAETEAPYAEAAAQAKAAAAARKDLVERGRAVLVQAAAAKRSADLAQKAWDSALAADVAAREAADALEGDVRNVEKSALASENAVAGFQDALVFARQAADAYSAADFSLLEGYLSARAAAQQNALAADAAALAGDAELESVNARAYNDAEQEAVRIAADLPADPAQPVVDAYERLGGEADAAYQEARERASRADSVLRAYRENTA